MPGNTNSCPTKPTINTLGECLKKAKCSALKPSATANIIIARANARPVSLPLPSSSVKLSNCAESEKFIIGQLSAFSPIYLQLNNFCNRHFVNHCSTMAKDLNRSHIVFNFNQLTCDIGTIPIPGNLNIHVL